MHERDELIRAVLHLVGFNGDAEDIGQAAGFGDVRVLFYHYHCLPPMFQADVPQLFLRESLAMEDATDWRGYFMASAFMVAGKRV